MMISEIPKHISPVECDAESPNLYCPQCLGTLPESGACPAPCEYESGASKVKPLTYLQMLDKKLDALNERFDRLSKEKKAIEDKQARLQEGTHKAVADSPINKLLLSAGLAPLRDDRSAFQQLQERGLITRFFTPQEFSNMKRIATLTGKSIDEQIS